MNSEHFLHDVITECVAKKMRFKPNFTPLNIQANTALKNLFFRPCPASHKGAIQTDSSPTQLSGEPKKCPIFAPNEIFCVNLQRKKQIINNKN